MAPELLDVLKNIHNELIVSNYLTKQDKQNQRRVFEFENNYRDLYKQLANLERRIETWYQENLKDAETMSEEEFAKRCPDLNQRYDMLNKEIDEVESDLKEYKEMGFVVRVQL